MKIHHLDIEGAFRSLQSSANGLSAVEAERRLQEYGPNELDSMPRDPVWLHLIKGFIHFFALVLWCAAALVFVAEIQQPGQGMKTLGAAIVAVIVINGLFSFWQERRAENALDALRRLMPQQVKVMRGGAVMLIPSAQLVPGDVILLQCG